MAKEVFQKETSALEQAQEALADSRGLDEEVDRAFRVLVKRYEKLLRQSRRMVTMGDRIQNSLNRLNRELTASESKYRGVFENVTEGIYRCAGDGGLIEVNPAMASMFGFADGESLLEKVKGISELFCDMGDYERYVAQVRAGSLRHYEVEVCGVDGQTLWVEISAGVIPGDEDAEETVVGVMADVTERKTMLEEMCRLARTDSLTGLWNRGYFMELAGREIARCRRNESNMGMLIADVDFFKGVNDTYGHDVGDLALIGLAKVLLASVREVDVVGRYGGEEFVVLLPDASSDEACMVAKRIRRNLRERKMDCGEVELPMTVSIGLTSLEGEDDLDGLLKFADIALYAAKKKGRDRVEVYQRGARACDILSGNSQNRPPSETE